MSKSFAFLVHPRNTISADMGDLFGAPFAMLPDAFWSKVLATIPVPPQITGKMSFADSAANATGMLITVPFTPRQFLEMPRKKVQARISAAVDLARDKGAEIVGLGALTAPASAGGKLLEKRTDIGVTNGNAFTAAMTLAGVERLLEGMGRDPLIAFVGATGSVGSCLVRLFARKHSGRIMLLARNEVRTKALANEVRRDDLSVQVSVDMHDVKQADLVVLLTSASHSLLNSEHLKEGAIVLDDTVPRNTDPKLLDERPDVTIVDGGLVEVPGVKRKGEIGLPQGLAYACLAETMLLSLEGHEGHFSIGAPEVEQAEYMLDAARRHQHIGFNLAPFLSFGRPVSTEFSIPEAIECVA